MDSCAEQRCSGRGVCVSRDKGEEVACECSHGYSGDSCQNVGSSHAGSSHLGLILTMLLIVGCTVVAIFVIRKRY